MDRVKRIIYIAALGFFLTAAMQASAQNLPGGTIQQQNPQAPSSVTISPIQPASAPTSGLPANVLTPATTNQLEPAAGAPGRAPVFLGAGRGLPGMPGGPPVNSPMGARDPAAQYMRPPTVGPLICDPAVDVAC
jgi:hypothetical protein